MKKNLFLSLLILLGVFTISTSFAQKKAAETETQISVNYPILSVIYEDGLDAEGNELGMADLQIHDRQGQTNDVDFHRMNAQSRSNEPVSPKVKVIFMEELGGFNFRLAENMEERKREPDGETVLLIEYRQMVPATRVKFPNQN